MQNLQTNDKQYLEANPDNQDNTLKKYVQEYIKYVDSFRPGGAGGGSKPIMKMFIAPASYDLNDTKNPNNNQTIFFNSDFTQFRTTPILINRILDSRPQEYSLYDSMSTDVTASTYQVLSISPTTKEIIGVSTDNDKQSLPIPKRLPALLANNLTVEIQNLRCNPEGLTTGTGINVTDLVAHDVLKRIELIINRNGLIQEDKYKGLSSGMLINISKLLEDNPDFSLEIKGKNGNLATYNYKNIRSEPKVKEQLDDFVKKVVLALRNQTKLNDISDYNNCLGELSLVYDRYQSGRFLRLSPGKVETPQFCLPSGQTFIPSDHQIESALKKPSKIPYIDGSGNVQLYHRVDFFRSSNTQIAGNTVPGSELGVTETPDGLKQLRLFRGNVVDWHRLTDGRNDGKARGIDTFETGIQMHSTGDNKLVSGGFTGKYITSSLKQPDQFLPKTLLELYSRNEQTFGRDNGFQNINTQFYRSFLDKSSGIRYSLVGLKSTFKDDGGRTGIGTSVHVATSERPKPNRLTRRTVNGLIDHIKKVAPNRLTEFDPRNALSGAQLSFTPNTNSSMVENEASKYIRLTSQFGSLIEESVRLKQPLIISLEEYKNITFEDSRILAELVASRRGEKSDYASCAYAIGYTKPSYIPNPNEIDVLVFVNKSKADELIRKCHDKNNSHQNSDSSSSSINSPSLDNLQDKPVINYKIVGNTLSSIMYGTSSQEPYDKIAQFLIQAFSDDTIKGSNETQSIFKKLVSDRNLIKAIDPVNAGRVLTFMGLVSKDLWYLETCKILIKEERVGWGILKQTISTYPALDSAIEFYDRIAASLQNASPDNFTGDLKETRNKVSKRIYECKQELRN